MSCFPDCFPVYTRSLRRSTAVLSWRSRRSIREITEKSKKFHAMLDAKGLKYRDLLELEVLAHSLGDMGHHILLGYERGEGWPSGT